MRGSATARSPRTRCSRRPGKLGLLGVNKPEAFGGMGLDYSYQMVSTEELGTCHGGSIPMALGVQTDMATPALARWGSDALKREFLAPAIAGDVVCAIAVSEASGGLRRRGDQDGRAQRRQRLRDQRFEDVDHERRAS